MRSMGLRRAVFLGLLVAACHTPMTNHRELRYRGETADHWFRRIEDLDSTTRHKALTALSCFGAEVAARLVSLLAHERPEVAVSAHEALRDMEERAALALEIGLKHPDARARLRSAILLTEIWTGDAPRAWSLVESARGSETNADLFARLPGVDSEERLESAVVLFVISDGVDRERVAPILCGALAAMETHERVLAAGILARVGMEVSRSVSVLIRVLGSDTLDWHDRHVVIESLGSIGPPAASAIPALLRVAEESADPSVIALVADAVARIRVE